MNIIIFHAGFIGDIIVCGQNFALGLLNEYPHAKIDFVIQKKVAHVEEIICPLDIFHKIIVGGRNDYENIKKQYDKHFLMDELVYPEGHLRTPFLKANIPFNIYPITIKTSSAHKKLAAKIVGNVSKKIIVMQEDMNRKWDDYKVVELKKRLSKIAKVITVGPSIIHKKHISPLSFLESVALIQMADLFVGIDSGIAHGAALSGTQTILIPPIHPESWISPTEYGNKYRKNKKHISIRPESSVFCGHYFCLKPDKKGGTSWPHGDPLKVKCPYHRKYYFFKEKSCFAKIDVSMIYDVVSRELLR